MNTSLSEFSDRLVNLNDGSSGLRAGMHVEIRDDSSPSCLEFVSSDETLDRYNEVISAAGWKLDNYQRNPVFQNAHQYGDIIFTLGKALVTEIREVGRAVPSAPSRQVLFQRTQFATDVNPMARIAYGLYRGKFLNAVSVGFVPIRWQDGSGSLSAGGEGRGEVESFSASASSSSSPARRIFLEQELLEVSAVAIPANPNALALGLKSGAIAKSDLKDVLDLFRLALERPPGPLSAGAAGEASVKSESYLGRREVALHQPSTTETELLQMAYDLQALLRS